MEARFPVVTVTVGEETGTPKHRKAGERMELTSKLALLPWCSFCQCLIFVESNWNLEEPGAGACEAVHISEPPREQNGMEIKQ